MARLALLVTAILAVAATGAEAATIAQQSFGLAGNNIPTHANHFNRDGLASQCNDPAFFVPTETTTPELFSYKTRPFQSSIDEPACVTATLATMCSGADAVMSETYSPSYDPAHIRVNWIGDLGDNPPAQTSYSFNVAAGARFETVIEEETSTANCGGVTITWTSDRPWANGRPFVSGIPAVGHQLGSAFDAWAGDPSVARQWLRCDAAGAGCVDIPGATEVSYTPTDADIGHALALRETATENGMTSSSESRPTTPVFIPALVQEGSLGAGDSSMTQKLSVTGPPSSCETPKSAPGATGFNDLHLYDAFPVTSLINEPACMWVTRGFDCGLALTTVYSPAFAPASPAQNYVADDSRFGTLSYTLAPGANSVTVLSDYDGFNLCMHYTLVVGSIVPFATAPPILSGPATEGAPQTTTDGVWGGAPSYARSWRRCDQNGDNCVPIDGATGASYTPTAADVGHRLRTRVTATQVNSASADSAPSAVIVPDSPPAGGKDTTPPGAKLALARTNLARVVKRGFIPVNVTCDEDCAITVRAVVTKKLARRLGGRRKIASGKGSGKAGVRARVRVKLTRRARRALRGRRILRFRLEGGFADAAGNRSTARRRAALRRRR